MENFKLYKILSIVAVCISLLVMGLGFHNQDPLRVGVIESVESQIVSEMIALLASQSGHTVELVDIQGDINAVHPATAGGAIDLYADYTSVAWSNILQEKETYHQSLFSKLEKQYNSQGLSWIAMTEVSNLWTLAMSIDEANKQGIQTLSDLTKIDDQLIIGTDSNYMNRQDGFPLLEKEYGISFKSTQNMPQNLQYQALTEDKIQVMPVNGTDAHLKENGLIALEDDLGVLKHGQLGFVGKQKRPASQVWLDTLLTSLCQTLQVEDMVHLKELCQNNGWNPKTVSRAYLQKKNLLKK